VDYLVVVAQGLLQSQQRRLLLSRMLLLLGRAQKSVLNLLKFLRCKGSSADAACAVLAGCAYCSLLLGPKAQISL
jgi:hypothetical protein